MLRERHGGTYRDGVFILAVVLLCVPACGSSGAVPDCDAGPADCPSECGQASCVDGVWQCSCQNITEPGAPTDVFCLNASNCAPGKVCCEEPSGTACEDACDVGKQICATSSECGPGQACVTSALAAEAPNDEMMLASSNLSLFLPSFSLVPSICTAIDAGAIDAGGE